MNKPEVTYGLTLRDLHITQLQHYCGFSWEACMNHLKATYEIRKAQHEGVKLCAK